MIGVLPENGHKESQHNRTGIFNLHIAPLCAQSGFFRQALQENSREADHKVLHLRDYSPEVFDLFVSWL